MIGLKESRQFFNQCEAKPRPIYTRDFSCASSELQIIARNCEWFIALPAPVVIGRRNCFGFGFSTVIWKPLSGLNLSTGYPAPRSISTVLCFSTLAKSQPSTQLYQIERKGEEREREEIAMKHL